jgi:L-alanine-DL-glutamate epimerase-like enolase superfamily enzyme
MKLERIEVFVFEHPSRITRNSEGTIRIGDEWPALEMIVRLTSEDGTVGSAAAEDPMVVDGLRGRSWVVEDLIAPVLLGRDHSFRERIWSDLRRLQRLFATALPDRTLHIIDLALWDLAGKIHNLPVYKLIGAYRDSVPAYASTMLAQTEGSLSTAAHFADFAEQCYEAGYRAFKLHTWGPLLEPSRGIGLDIEACAAVRERVGGDMKLMLDPYHFYNRIQARDLGRAISELDFYWYEEPMDEDSIDSYRWLREQVDVAIVGPEVAGGKAATRAEWIKSGACDIARTGSLDVGGITPVLKIVGLCEAFNIPLTMHLGGLSSLHILATMPGDMMFEHGLLHPDLPLHGKPAWQVEPSFAVDEDGHVQMPERPGLGWSIDWDFVTENTVEHMEVTF